MGFCSGWVILCFWARMTWLSRVCSHAVVLDCNVLYGGSVLFSMHVLLIHAFAVLSILLSNCIVVTRCSCSVACSVMHCT